MPRSHAWKDLERDVAAALGGKRHVRAHRGEPGPDVDMPPESPFAVECKYRKNIPRLLLDGLAQAEANGKGKTPLLIVKQRRQAGALACLRLEDLVKLLSNTLEREEEHHVSDTDPATSTCPPSLPPSK